MRAVLVSTAALLLLCGCIGWSDDQQEVVDVYREISEDVSDENWRGFRSNLSQSTRDMLDDLMELYAQSGASLLSDTDQFLSALAMETEVLDFPEAIHSVEFSGDRAVLVADDGYGARSYEFHRESGRWKLSLIPVLNELYTHLMQGISFSTLDSSGGTAVPSYISTGSGPCLLLVRNMLQGVAVHNVFCSLSTSDSWGNDHLGPSILGTGSELGLNLQPGTYDIQVFDSMERSYTLWGIQVDENGVLWELTEADLDQN